MEEETGGSELVVAVGLAGGRKSKYILRWALDKFLPEGNVRFKLLHVYPKISIVPTPIGTWLPVAQVRQDVADRYQKEVEWKKKQTFLPYQKALEAQKVVSDIVVLESDNIAMALCTEVNRNSIRHLVIGCSSSTIFSRKNLSLTKMMGDHNLSTVITDKAPGFCSVYVVADGKLQNLRPAESEPTEITMDNTNGLPSTYIDSSSSSPALTLGCLLTSRPSSPRYLGTTPSDSAANTFKPRESESHQNNMPAPSRVSESADINQYTFQDINKNFGNASPVSQSSSSGDSGSWSFDRTPPGLSVLVGTPPGSSVITPVEGSFVGTPPTGSYIDTPPAVSFTGTPTASTGTFRNVSSADITPPGSFMGTPAVSFTGTPTASTGTFRNVSSADITSPGSFMGTPPAVSFTGTPTASMGTFRNVSSADITPPGSFMGTPPAVSFAGVTSEGPSVGDPHQATLPLGQNAELNQLRMELRHIEKMYELAQNDKINEKLRFPLNQLNDLSKEQLEAALKLKDEKSKEIMSTEKDKQKAVQHKAVESGKEVEINTPRNRAQERAAEKAEENENKLRQLIANPITQCQKFSWDEIVEATSSLSEEFKIGAGAFGTVYKCKLHHTTVAVKVLSSKDAVANKQFLQELEILSTIRHPHLLLLLGAVPEQSCLVYEYMENGSLDDRLFRKGNCPPLPWYDRVRVCWEVASALAFLHSTKPKPIIHRDLKPANILLDQHLVSKIGDAGLGTMINVEPSDKSLRTLYKETSPVGTLCYIDPEYQRTGRVSTKSDIYALGVMILQLLTAKPAVGVAYLVEDAVDEGTLTEILDEEAGSWPEDAALTLVSLGLQCSELRGRDRPDLREIVLPTLEKLKERADSAREQAASAPAALPTHFICPIHKDVMDDPYVAADGYTYDRVAIEKWLAENNTSPTTKLPLPHKFIMPNTTMLEAINQWKSKQPPK